MNANKAGLEEKVDALYRMMIVFRVVVIFIASCGTLFLLFFHSPSLFHPNRYLLRAVLSLGHVPLFGLIAWTVLLAINLRNLRISTWPTWSYAVAFLFTLGLSLLTEFLQIITPRDANIGDVFLNALGATLFLGAGLLWINREFSARFSRWQKRLRWVFVLVSVTVVAFLVYPIAMLAIDEIQARASFPIVASFESEMEMRRWDAGNNEVSLSQDHVDEGKYSLRVALSPGRFSGISMTRPPSDWRGFDSFDLTVFNPSNKNLMIMLKIFDWDHKYKYDDRFNRLLHIFPGKNAISMPIQEIKSAPATRRMQMDKIGQISFFMRNLGQEQVLYFDRIRLSKRK